MSNEENKMWYQSKAIWGSIVAVVATVIALFGYTIPQEQTTELIMQIVTVIGGLLALYGRIVASKSIGKKPVEKPEAEK